MVSSFFKTRSFAVLTPAISTFPCMRSAPSDPETSWPQYDRRAFSYTGSFCHISPAAGNGTFRPAHMLWAGGVSAVQCRIRE